MERRLSAIYAADMVGYSRLIEADEVGTLERQNEIAPSSFYLHPPLIRRYRCPFHLVVAGRSPTV